MLDSHVEQVGRSGFEGFVENDLTTRRNRLARVYFVAKCNRDLKSFRTFAGRGTGLGAYLEFERSRQPLEIKIAISFTSISGARENHANELPDWILTSPANDPAKSGMRLYRPSKLMAVRMRTRPNSTPICFAY